MSEDNFVKTQCVLPSQRDIFDAERLKLPLLPNGRNAVFVRKLSAKKAQFAMAPDAIASDQELIKELSIKRGKGVLVNFQYAENTVLTQKHLDYFEELQQVPELEHRCMVERSPNQPAADFKKQLEGFLKRNPGKTCVVTTEPFTMDLLDKIAIAKKMGVTKWAVLFRTLRKHDAAFRRILATLTTEKLFSFVLGIFYKKQRTTGASMLLPALRFGANAVAAWIPWGGGPAELSLLCEDWVFRPVKDATPGFTDYGGKNRLQIVKSGKAHTNTTFERIDTLNQVAQLIDELPALTEERFIRLFQN